MTKEEAIELHLQFSDAKLVVDAFAEPMTNAKKELDWRIKQVKDLWNETNAELIKNHTEAETKATDLEAKLRNAIVELYDAQDDKTIKSGIIPGWGVAVSEGMQFTEGNSETTAIQWLIEHNHREALKLDSTKFKELAEVLKPDFVKFVPVATAKINPIKGGK